MRKAEKECSREKIKCKCDFADKEARNAFNHRNVIALMMICAHGFNHYGLRDSLMNKNIIDAHCTRCQEVETWDHVTK